MKWINAVLVTVLGLLHFTQSAEIGNEKGFLLTVPRSVMRKNVNEFVLNLYNVDAPGSITLSLLKSENDTVIAENTTEIEAGTKEKKLKLYIPYVDDYELRLRIKGAFDTDDGYDILGEDTVYLREPVPQIIFIQTDKPLYKPGQEVKFRVLPLDQNLRPLGKDVLGDIWVEDPSNSRVAQWKGVPLGSGVKQLEFLLSDEPNLGLWKISVKIENDVQTADFEVKEYVLPKFEVIIHPPSYILITAETIPLEICAKYTYGKLVEGTIRLNITLETYSWAYDKFPNIEYEGDIEGCHKYNLNVSLIDENLQHTYRRIQAFAEVTEKGTGITRNETKYLDRTQRPLYLSIQTDKREYFKPGLPYNGEVKVTYPDSSPAAGEPIQICMTISRERVLSEWWATRKVKYCRNFTSDENGKIAYTVPPQNSDAVSMNIEAKSLKYGGSHSRIDGPTLYQPQASAYLRPWFSPTGSHLQVQADSTTFQCKTKNKIKILFTTNDTTTFRFYYEVINRDKILQKDSLVVEFDIESDISKEICNDITLDAEEIQLVPPPVKDGESSSESDNQCKAMKDARYVPYVGTAEVELDITTAHSPSFQFLIYYIRDDRETVADSQEFNVEKCFNNEVEFKFEEETRQPGTKATYTLSASPNSLCGVRVIDKSISLLDSTNAITKEKVFEELRRFDYGIKYPRNHCNERRLQPGLRLKTSPSGNYIIPPRPPPRPWSSSSYEDTLTAFEITGFLAISDFTLLTRPCKTNSPSYEAYGGIALPSVGVDRMSFSGTMKKQAAPAAARRPVGMGAAAESQLDSNGITKSAVDVRSFFPETWLFEMEVVGEEGTVTKKKVLPHTITEWIGDAVCVNKENGLGLSDTARIRGFQSFFLSFTLPYSVIRGEKVPVLITVFNYLKKCLPISLELEQTDGFTLLSDSPSKEYCVCGGKSETHRYVIQPTTLGTVNLTVHGKTAESSDICGNLPTADVIARDAIVNPLLVEAEGFPVEKVESILFCPKDASDETFKREISFTLPDDVISDSARGYIAVSGDIMGPTIEGLGSLVRMPMGCGEQNMVLFAPNIYVLDYLEATGQITEEIKNRAIQHLKTGYQREMKYRHGDGSYSAFGVSDREGSMFLTAFVVKCFAQAQKYIEIDTKNLEQTQQWITSKQREDGCFPEVGRTLSHGLKGGIDSQNSSASMTAYVLTSLLISGVDNSTMIDSALSCLEREKDLTPFKAALFAYTAALAGSNTSEKFLEKLYQKAQGTGDQKYWKNGKDTESLDVETAAYALLTLLKLDTGVDRSLPVVRWMTKNRNAHGGFISTQDTVLGLEALGKFATLISQDPVDLQLKVTDGVEQDVALSEDDKLLVKKYKVPNVPSDLQVQATGSGCGVLQSILRYNTEHAPKKQYFELEIDTETNSEENCKYITIKICARYVPESELSNMALIEIKMISGMVPLKESLLKLQGDPNLGMKRFDVNNNNVVLYFDEFSNERKCFHFVVEEVLKVGDLKPAVAKIYDYYATERIEETSYEAPECE